MGIKSGRYWDQTLTHPFLVVPVALLTWLQFVKVREQSYSCHRCSCIVAVFFSQLTEPEKQAWPHLQSLKRADRSSDIASFFGKKIDEMLQSLKRADRSSDAHIPHEQGDIVLLQSLKRAGRSSDRASSYHAALLELLQSLKRAGSSSDHLRVDIKPFMVETLQSLERANSSSDGICSARYRSNSECCNPSYGRIALLTIIVCPKVRQR